MAYGVIIRASAATAEGTHTIEVLRRGYSGAVHTVHAGAPFYTEEYGQRGADLDADIRPSQVTASLVITDAAALGAVRGTLSAESREYRMVVRHGAAVMWQGYVMPVTSVTRLDDGPATVRVVAKDRVRSLDDQVFAGAGGAPYTGQAALSTILERELGYAGHSITQHEYAARFRPAGVSDPYAQVRIDQARFYDDETGEPTHSRGDVVRAILGTQQAQLTQWRGRWEVTTPHAAGDTFSVDRWVARSDELSGEPPARQGRASYDVGGTASAILNPSFEMGHPSDAIAPHWTSVGKRVWGNAADGQYVGTRTVNIVPGPLTESEAATWANGFGYQRVPIVVASGSLRLSLSAGGQLLSPSGAAVPVGQQELWLFIHLRHTAGYYYNPDTGQWQGSEHKILLGKTFTVGRRGGEFTWIRETIVMPPVPEGGEVEIGLYTGVIGQTDTLPGGWTAEAFFDAIEFGPESATGREVISFTSYSPAVQDGETESVEVPIGDGPFESARGAMRLASGVLTSEWRVGSESRVVPHTQILAEHLMRTRGKGRRRVRLTTTGPVSEMAPVKKMQLGGALYWPTYMEIEWPLGQATIEGIEMIDVPVPSGVRETVEVRPAGPSAQAGAHRVYDYVQDQGYAHESDLDNYLLKTGGTLTGDLVFDGGGRISAAGPDALEVLSEDGTNHGELTVRVLRVLDKIDAIETDILEVQDSYIKVNRGQTGTPSLNGGLIAERGQTDAYLEWDEGRDRWGWRMGEDIDTGTFRAFVDESRTIDTQLGISGGGNLGSDLHLTLTGQAQQLHLATGTGVFKRTSGGVIGVNLVVNADIETNTITNNRLVNPHITLNAGAGIAAIGQVDLGGSSSITLSQRLQGVHGASNGILVGTSNGAASRTIQGTTNQVNVSNGNGVSGNPTLSLPQDIHTGANVQLASLHTRLSGRVPILLERTGTNAVQWSMGFWGDAFAIQQGDDISASAQLYIQPDSGNVGIGTTSPSHRLDVSGTGRISGLLTLGAQATSASHALRADRTLRIQGTANRISVNNDAALNLTSNRTWQITAPQDLHTDADFLTKTLRTKDWAGSTSFASGWTGHGWRAEDDHLEVTDLTVRNRLRVYELLIEQIRANNGSVAISNAAEVASVSGSTITLDEGVPVPFVVGDILRAQRFTGEGVYVSMIRVTSVGSGSFGFTLLEGDAPAEGMEYVRVGNTTDEDRQGLVYLTASDSGAPFIDILDGIDDHTKWNSSDVVRSRFGRLDGLTVPGFGQLEGYGGYIQRGYIDKEVIIGGAGLSIDSFQQRPSALWHFDGNLVDSINGATPEGYEDATITDYGLVTGDGLVATLRQDGRFGGGVAVEEGTENLIGSGGAVKFVDGWSQHQGATVTRTQLPDGRILIETSGGTSTIKTYFSAGVSQDGVPYSTQVWVQNVGDVPVVVGGNLGGSIVTVSPGETVKAVAENRIGDGNTTVQIQFRSVDASHNLKFIAWHPQVEANIDYATSFVEGSRPLGQIRIANNPTNIFTSILRLRVPHDYHQGSLLPTWYFDGIRGHTLTRYHNGQFGLDARDLSWATYFGEADTGDDVTVAVVSHGGSVEVYFYNHTTGETDYISESIDFWLGDSGLGTWAIWASGRITTQRFDYIATFPYALSASEIRRIALSDAPIQERPSQVRITGEQILVGTDTLIKDGFIQSKYIAANSLTAEQLSFTPLLSADGTGDIVATINATSEGLRIAGSKIEINGDVHFTSDLYDPSKKATPGDIDDAIDAYDDTLGDLSKQDLVEDAMRGEGLISGAYLKMDLIDTESLFAQQASIGDWDIVSGNITSSGVTLNSSGYISLADNAGISGTGSGNDAVRMWAGDTYANRASAAFNVRHDGTLNATKAHVEGEIVATSGLIGDWQIETGKLTGGSIELLSNGKIWQTDNRWALNDDGSGRLANGNISWTDAGEVTFGSGVSLSWSQVDSRPTSLSDLDSSAASTLSTASSTASNALSAANTAQSDATAAGQLADSANTLANQINTRTANIHETYIDATEIKSPTITGNQGVFTGYVTAGNLRIGTGVNGVNNNGIWINATNYWYDTGNFGLGAGDSRIRFTTQNGLSISNTHLGLSESNLRLGKEDERHITLANGSNIHFMDGTTSLASISGTTFRIGQTSAGNLNLRITNDLIGFRTGTSGLDLLSITPNEVTIGEPRPDGSNTYLQLTTTSLNVRRGSQTLASFGATINIQNALRVDAAGNGTFEGSIYATGGTFDGVVNATEINADSGTVGGMALSPSGFFGDLLTIDQERGMVRVSGDFALGDFSPTSSGSRLVWSTSNYTALSHSVETSTSTPATYTSAWQTWDNSNLAEKQLKITYTAGKTPFGESHAIIDVQMRSGSTVVSDDTLGASSGGVTTLPIPAGVTDIRFRTRLRAEADIDDARVPPRVIPGSAHMSVSRIAADSNQPFVGPRGALWRHPLTNNPMATVNGMDGRMYANSGHYWTDNSFGGINAVGDELGRDVYTIRIDENNGALVVLRYTESGVRQHRYVQMQGSGWVTS